MAYATISGQPMTFLAPTGLTLASLYAWLKCLDSDTTSDYSATYRAWPKGAEARDCLVPKGGG